MGAVQLEASLIEKGHRGVDSQLEHGDSSRLYELELFEAWIGSEQLFNFFKSEGHLLVLWHEFCPIEDTLVDSNIDIAILDCDPVGATAEELDGDRVVLEEELYP